MIRFESVTYRNILSVGQAPITIDLCSHRLTALHGQSGSGKSLFLDAISFALFGKAFRDINKTDLINTINGKALMVELEFSVGRDKYKISRGLKPNVFQIEVNGSTLNQESHTKDQQKFLEDQILKMNWKMFTHVVMLGAANYTPFMRLKPNERRKMVENILGIDVFSTMNAVIKTKISDETIKYKSITEKRDSLVQQVTYLEQQQKAFEQKVQEEIKVLTDKLIGLRDLKKSVDLDVISFEQELEVLIESFDPKVEIAEFTETFDETFTEQFTETFNEQFEEVSSSEFDPSELVNARATMVAEIKGLNEKLQHAEEHLAFYNDNNTCPTCSQEINQSFRKTSIADLEGQILDIKKSIEVRNADILVIKNKAEELLKRKKEYADALLSFRAKREGFDRKKESFESRRRTFEGKLRAFETRRRQHEESSRKALALVEEKRKEFDKVVAAKRKQLEEKRGKVAIILTEAKLIKENIEEKKNKPLLDNSSEIARIQSELTQLGVNLDESAKRLKMLREAQIVIKDDGVKSEILKRYVPTLNKHINQYLTRMGMFVSFELDQEFNDTIRSRHRDVLSYGNYSEGERQRLDLAVLFAWRHLAQTQSAVNTNLLVLDEVLDSYLDQATTETILGLMKGEEFQSFNIIVISHKEGLSENFDKTLQFQKKNNFTSIC